MTFPMLGHDCLVGLDVMVLVLHLIYLEVQVEEYYQNHANCVVNLHFIHTIRTVLAMLFVSL